MISQKFSRFLTSDMIIKLIRVVSFEYISDTYQCYLRGWFIFVCVIIAFVSAALLACLTLCLIGCFIGCCLSPTPDGQMEKRSSPSVISLPGTVNETDTSTADEWQSTECQPTHWQPAECQPTHWQPAECQYTE